jgi:hypothetical protein
MGPVICLAGNLAEDALGSVILLEQQRVPFSRSILSADFHCHLRIEHSRWFKLDSVIQSEFGGLEDSFELVSPTVVLVREVLAAPPSDQEWHVVDF